MYVIGLTGGIGCGKTTFSNLLSQKNIPVYNSDRSARRLMESNEVLKEKIQKLFGKQAYCHSQLDRSFIAKKVFTNKVLLNTLNHLVHPFVREDFDKWRKEQKSFYCIKESAILFESGLEKNCDMIITLCSPLNERIKRIEKRDHLEKKEIRDRMKNQLSDKERIQRSDIIVMNDKGLDQLFMEANRVHNEIIDKFIHK